MHPIRRAFHAALAVSAIAMATMAHAADANISYLAANQVSAVVPTSASSTVPPGYRNWTSSSGVAVSYPYDASCACLTIEVENTTTSVQHFAMVSNTELAPVAGDYLRLQSNIEVESATPESARASTVVGVGFENYNATKSQLMDGPLSAVEQSKLNTQQNAVSYYAAGTAVPRYDEAFPYLQARLKVYNILPGAKIKLKVRSLTVQVAKLTGIWIRPMDTLQVLRPAQPFRLTAGLIAQASVANHQSAIRFVYTGAYPGVTNHPPKAVALSSNLGTGEVRDSWNVPTAPNTPGIYNVYYRLILPSSNVGAVLKPTDPTVVESATPVLLGSGKQYLIGQIKVDANPPMDIGNAFHSIQPNNAPVAYDFARSLSHDKTKLDNWWEIAAGASEPVMAWEKSPSNSNFSDWVAAVSSSGRKALITFYGMRTEIAANPTVTGAWGASVNPGFVSAPTPSGLVAYGKVVRKTVAKFKDSIYAVECWNEPDSTGHFVGSTTQLADLCQTVYTQTKAVDTTNQIKILCPQATTPAGIGWILGARTSDNHAITDYCDTVGSHLYGYTGDDATGKPYSVNALSNAIKDMKNRIAQFPGAVNKALAVTEFGTHQCLWNGGFTQKYSESTVAANNALKGDIVYNSLLTLKEQNVRTVALYSYDNRGENPAGCYIDNYSWQYLPGPDAATPGTPNTPVINKINAAVANF